VVHNILKVSYNGWRICEAAAGGLGERSEPHIRLLGEGE